MANSLSDQLLQAGLVTADQVEKAKQPRPDKPKRPRQENRSKQAKTSGHKPPQPRKNKAPDKSRSGSSDLARFYAERAKTEREERQQEEQRQREMAERRKKTRKQVASLVADNQQNVDDADIRYNFMVGDNIKYLYVTEQQQQDLAAGKLAITFQAGKRCLIPVGIGKQIMELDPDKIVVINHPDEGETATG